MKKKLKFWHMSQNNSGGNFDFVKNKLTHHMVIQAESAREADFILEGLGGYFDGCHKGIDCDCCGDRWSRAYGDGTDKPMIYEHDVSKGVYRDGCFFMGDKPEGYIHYKNGKVVPVKGVKGKD